MSIKSAVGRHGGGWGCPDPSKRVVWNHQEFVSRSIAGRWLTDDITELTMRSLILRSPSSGAPPWLLWLLLFGAALVGVSAQASETRAPDDAGLALSDHERAWIRRHSKVVFTGEPERLPYEALRPDGTHIGMVADHLRIVAEMTGLRFEPLAVADREQALDAVRAGKVWMASGDAADPVLNRHFTPVTPYSRHPVMIVMNQRHHFVDDLKRLRGQAIAVIAGSAYLSELNRRYPELDFTVVDDIREGLDGVSNGHFDALLATEALALFHIAATGLRNVKIVGKAPLSMNLTLFVHPDLPVLHGLIEKALGSISAARSEEIQRKWVRGRYLERTDYRMVAEVAIALLLVIGFVLLWNRRLSREIERRRQTEQALTHSRALLRDVIDELPDLLALKDEGGRFLLCNQALARFCGSVPERMIGKREEELGLSPQVAELFCLDRSALPADGAAEVVYQDGRVGDSGDVRHFKSLKKLLEDARGRSQLLVIAQDITDSVCAQAEIVRSEAKYRRLVDNLTEEYFFYKHDRSGVFSYVSPSVSKMLGWEQDEFLRHFSEFVTDHPLNAEVTRNTELGLRGLRQPPYLVVARHRDGGERWLEVTEIPVFDEHGGVLELEGIAHDITERKHTEDRLRLQAMVLDQIQDHVTVTDLDGRIIYVNQAELDGIGHSRAEILGRHVDAYGNDPAADATQKEILRKTLERGAWQGRVVNQGEDGGRLYLELRTSLVRDDAGAPLALVGIGTDITQRMQAEEALRNSERQLLDAQEIAHIGHWELDIASGRAHWSRELHSIFGTDPQREIGSGMLSGLVHPQDWPMVNHAMNALIREGTPYDVEYRIRRADGEERWLHSRARCRFDENGEADKLMGIAHDITERKQAEIRLRDSERRFRRLFEHTDAIAVQGYDRRRNVIYWNPASEKLYGYSAEQAIGRKLEDLIIPSEMREQVVAAVNAWTDGGPALPSAELVLRRADGSPVTVFSSHTMLRGVGGAREMYCIDVDLSPLKQAEKKIRLLSQAVEQSPVSVVITDPAGHIEYVNQAFERITGYSAAEAVGRNVSILKSGRTAEQVYGEMWQRIVEGREWEGELLNRKKSGELFWEHAHIAPVVDDGGRTISYLAVKEDISLRKAQEEKILRQAHYDALTGLPNRFLVLDRLSHLLSKAERRRQPVGILFLDLDDFKKVNDTLGHDVGDRVLVLAGERVSAAVRAGDTVGRLGGDEFVILLEDIARADDAGLVAEAVLEQFRTPFQIGGRDLLLTTSVGIALYPEDGATPADLLRSADSAMYHSKELGRNTYSFFTDTLNQGIARRLALEEQLSGALERREFRIHYQPKVAVDSGRIEGMEALIRWHNPTLGEVSPSEFIPVVEQSGLIRPIGRFVLTEALTTAGAWQRRLGRPLSVAVNLSPRQFRDADLVPWIGELVERARVAPGSLELEITEGVLMTRREDVEKALSGLSELGVRLVMDDFGTGYSSLSYLRTFPFDVVKIDRSFVRDMTTDPADRELVNAAIAMGHGLGLQVVAEGVETVEQLELLRGQGCDFAQGYLFSRPVSAEAMERLLQP